MNTKMLRRGRCGIRMVASLTSCPQSRSEASNLPDPMTSTNQTKTELLFLLATPHQVESQSAEKYTNAIEEEHPAHTAEVSAQSTTSTFIQDRSVTILSQRRSSLNAPDLNLNQKKKLSSTRKAPPTKHPTSSPMATLLRKTQIAIPLMVASPNAKAQATPTKTIIMPNPKTPPIPTATATAAVVIPMVTSICAASSCTSWATP